MVGLDDTDFRTLVLKIRKGKPDAVYFPLYKASLVSFAKQIGQSGYPGTLLSAEAITEHEVSLIGRHAEGMFITQAILVDPAFEKKYLEAYRLKKLEANLAYVALGYDAVGYLNECAERLRAEGKAISSENLRAVFKDLAHQGVLGATSFGNARSIQRGQSVLVVENGALKPIS